MPITKKAGAHLCPFRLRRDVEHDNPYPNRAARRMAPEAVIRYQAPTGAFTTGTGRVLQWVPFA